MAGYRSESGIDWDLERDLAARGYGFEDTDASALAADLLNMTDRFDEFQFTSDAQLGQEQERGISEMPAVKNESRRDEVPQGLQAIYRGRGVNRCSRELSLAELTGRGYTFDDTDASGSVISRKSFNGVKSEDEQGKLSRGLGGVRSSNLVPGTADTQVWKDTPVYMNRGQGRSSKSKDTREEAPPFSVAPRRSLGTSQPMGDTAKVATPKHFTWQDTDEYQLAKQRHGETQASKMFPPKPPISNIKKEDIVRPTVWKSPPVAPMTDHRCRDQSRSSATPSVAGAIATARRDPVSVEEKRRMATRSLPEEPPAGCEDVITIAIKLPSGKQTRRRFFKTDSLRDLKNFIWSQKDAPNNFQVYTNCPRRILECSSSHSKPVVDTFENAGITSNEILHVEACKY